MHYVARLSQAARGLGLAEHPVDGIQHRRRRAKRDIEVDRHELLLGDADSLGEPLAHLLELAWVGALKAEDRLLGVTHRTHRAAALDRTAPDKQFLCQAANP